MSQEKKVYRIQNTPFRDFFNEDPQGIELRKQLFKEEINPVAEKLAIKLSKEKRNLDTKRCLNIKVYNNIAHVTLQYVQGGTGVVPVPMDLVRAEMDKGLATSSAV